MPFILEFFITLSNSFTSLLAPLKTELNMTRLSFVSSILAFLMSTVFLFGQHQTFSSSEVPESADSHFRISAGLAHTYLSRSTVNGTEGLYLPTFMFDIEYWFNHKWGIGLHNDLELSTFQVIEEDGLFIEREYPVLFTLDALWKPYKGLVVFLGPGIEIEPSENYFVVRMGCEYEIPFSPHWDFSPLVYFDMRDAAYDTLTLGLGVGYSFGGGARHN